VLKVQTFWALMKHETMIQNSSFQKKAGKKRKVLDTPEQMAELMADSWIGTADYHCG
jgi:hypothetical protein